MRVKTQAVYIGEQESSFTNKDKEEINFRRASFNVEGELENCVFGIPLDVDTSKLQRFKDAYIVVDFSYNAQTRNYRGRLVEVLADKAAYDAYDVTKSDLPSYAKR